MALTQAEETVDAWVETAQNAVREGATKDISPNYVSALHIDMALSSTTAHTGTRIVVQVSSSASADEFWTNYLDFVGPTGTANGESITNNPAAAGTTVFTVADTTGYVADGILEVFLEDATPANSEIMMMVSAITNTSVTMQDGSTREHANTADFWNIAKSYRIEVPLGTLRVRVLYDNTYDVNGSTIFTRTRIVKVTALT